MCGTRVVWEHYRGTPRQNAVTSLCRRRPARLEAIMLVKATPKIVKWVPGLRRQLGPIAPRYSQLYHVFR